MLNFGRSFILLILKCVLTSLLLSVPTASDSAEAPSAAATLEATELRRYFLAIDSAHRLWLAGDIERAEQLLHETPPDLRGWEYQYLDRLFHSEKYNWVAQRWDGRGVRHVTFSPDGKLLAAACSDLTVKIWNVATGDVIQHLQQETKTVDFSPDGRLLAGGVGNTVTIWDVQTGEPVNRLSPRSGVAGVPHRVQYSPKDNRVAFVVCDSDAKPPRDFRVVVLDGKTREMQYSLRAPMPNPAVVSNAVFSGEGHYLDVGFALYQHANPSAGRIMVWAMDTGKIVTNIADIGGYPTALMFHPSGRRILAMTHRGFDKRKKGQAQIWTIADGERVLSIAAHDEPSFGAAFTPDGRLLATVGETRYSRGEVALWHVASGQPVLTIPGMGGHPQGVTFGSDGRHLVVVDGNGTIYVSE